MLKVSRAISLFALAGINGLYISIAFFNPYAAGGMTLPILGMMFLACTGVIAVLKAKPRIALGISLALFVPIGFYTMGTPGIFRWIGILNLLFVTASLMAWKARYAKEPQ